VDTCILLIDEDEDDRELFLIALDETGIEDVTVVQSYDGSHALKLLDDGLHPNYIFVDLNMPQVNGIQFLERIKKTENRDIPVVMYSTSGLEEDKKRTHDLGAIYFITKPNTIRELQNAISNVLRHEFDGLMDN
jgi:CheY-like chemotaxis protein